MNCKRGVNLMQQKSPLSRTVFQKIVALLSLSGEIPAPLPLNTSTRKSNYWLGLRPRKPGRTRPPRLERTAGIGIVIGLAFLIPGCGSTSKPEAASKAERRFGGVIVKIACPDKDAKTLVERSSRAWTAQTGAQ